MKKLSQRTDRQRRRTLTCNASGQSVQCAMGFLLWLIDKDIVKGKPINALHTYKRNHPSLTKLKIILFFYLKRFDFSIIIIFSVYNFGLFAIALNTGHFCCDDYERKITISVSMNILLNLIPYSMHFLFIKLKLN